VSQKTIEVALYGGPQDGATARVSRGCTIFAVTEIRKDHTTFGAYELDKSDGKFKYKVIQCDPTSTSQTQPPLDGGKPWPQDPLAPSGS
jgi:hypothetical protein